MLTSLPVINLSTATYECIFGRGCDGICCRDGRPPVYPEEEEIIRKHLEKFLPELRPEARKLIEREGFLSRRVKSGQPMLRVSGGWCVFFNQGCVLHKVGAAEGDKYRYKPSICALFPLEKNWNDQWYVRQWGFDNEPWDLPCLDPKASTLPASESLKTEIEMALRYEQDVAAKEAAALEGKPDA